MGTKRISIVRLALGVALALVVAVVGALSIYRKVETFQPLGFEAQQRGGVFAVTTVTDEATGLRIGDGILLVGGEQPSTSAALRSRLTANAETRLEVLRGGGLESVEYQRPGLSIDVAYLTLAAAGVVYLVVGLYALFQSRRSPAGIFFAWCLASATVFIYSFVPDPRPDLVARTIFGLEEAARLLVPALVVHFFVLFPSPLLDAERRRRVVPLVYLPSAALGALQLDLVLFGGRFVFGAVTPRAVALLDRLSLLLIVAGMLLALALLLGQLMRTESWQERRQLQWIALGVGGGSLPFLALYVLPWVLELSWPAWTTVIAVAPLTLVPLSFAWAILRYRLWDVELVLRDAVSYTATLLLGALAFSLLHLGIGAALAEEQQMARTLLTFVAGLVVAGVLVPAHRGVRAGVDRLRNRERYRQRRALARLGRELMEDRQLGTLCRRLVAHLEAGLTLARADLLLVDGTRLVSVSGSDGLAGELDSLPPALWSAPSIAIRPPDPLAVAPHGLLDACFADGYRRAYPLTIQGAPVGVLVVGHRRDGMPLDSEESDLVRSILNQAALAIENARLVGELRQQLDEVTELKRFSDRVLESSPAGIVVLGDGDAIVSANHAFGRLVGRDPAALAGAALDEVLPLSPAATVDGRLVEVGYCDAGGRERHLQISSGPTAGPSQGLRVFVVHDVTEQVAMERALEEKERLASLGMLAAGVAHEVNTPITGISSYAQMLLAETDESDPRYALLEKVERQTFRASSIVNNLLELARDRPRDLRPVVVADALAEALESVEPRLGELEIEVRWEGRDERVEVEAGRSELEQVFANLVSNAVDAMSPNGGTLTLSIEAGSESVTVVVADTGCGMTDEELSQIFQPFYSTKLARGGTGLGLSISRQAVHRLGGELTATSQPGAGSRFRVRLPRHRAAGAGS